VSFLKLIEDTKLRFSIDESIKNNAAYSVTSHIPNVSSIYISPLWQQDFKEKRKIYPSYCQLLFGEIKAVFQWVKPSEYLQGQSQYDRHGQQVI
jgi:hypothetical protein